MGGCRCYFRDCKVNTYKNPLMHFFRFPIKDTERYKKWREYSKQEQMVEYPINKQRNCVLCSRHFRDECFMNYKKERLTATAIPTIHRLSINKAIDFELDMENGTLVSISQPQLIHLIPPKEFECPLGLENDEAVWTKLRDIEKNNAGNGDVFDEVESHRNMFLVDDDVEDFAESVASNSAHILNTIDIESPPSLLKRSTKSLREVEIPDRVCSPNKRIKTLDQPQRLATATDPEQIFLPKGTTIELDNLESNNPTIINHQIIETDGNMWIEQESYNIADNGADYEFIESEKSISATENEVTLDELSASEQWQASCHEMENANAELLAEKKTIERNLLICQNENSRMEKQANNLKSEVSTLKKENVLLKRQLHNSQTFGETEASQKEKYQKQMEVEQAKHSETEEKLLQQIITLEQSLELVRKQLADTNNNLSYVQNEKIDLLKQQVEMDYKLQSIQEKYDNADTEHVLLEKNHDILQKTHKKLKEDYTKLESQQNQVSTVTTTNQTAKADVNPASAQQTTATVLTKAQLFNAIKRYISSSMVALLRMEMFGSSDREWKPDERQVAVDLLRLGESVYKYFTDEWRFRLPGLRDVRNWISQAVDVEDEEDL